MLRIGAWEVRDSFQQCDVGSLAPLNERAAARITAMEAVTWLLLLLSLFVAAWFVVRGSGIPTRAMMKVCEPNYPERLKHVFIVRAPWIFASLYALVKPLLNETTASKVAILGDDFATTLLEYIPKETLPVDLGGVAEPPAHIAPGGMVPKGALAAIADAAPLR